ncbi:LPD28 domain-containing protein [Porcipelethomonas sp.]|uniref:LPD28 domain-containing protein n=1 Tax=Porcipelethomonas sp. TaxID=2981675 RepID=UPI0030794920
MPNHVTNIIELNGDRLEIKNLLETIKNDEIGLGSIDFEKIIPMPDNIYRGDLGSKERELYGQNNWYDWSLANWGTKWNAYGYDEIKNNNPKEKITFLTAWAAPHPIMEKLAEMYPEVNIQHEWADEDIGMNCGRYCYSKGERVEEYFPEAQKDRIEFAVSVMNIDPESYGLYLNASEKEYINLSDEEYEVIEIAGEKALFTNGRITDEDIPKGLYCYHLRQSDDGERFAALENIVAVNHGGSVITKEHIKLGEKGYISLNEDIEPNFLGETTTIKEYFQDNAELSEDMGMEMSQI